ncbi:MAG: hypothetical protein ACOC80_00725 [Petrotogales bacterium]
MCRGMAIGFSWDKGVVCIGSNSHTETLPNEDEYCKIEIILDDSKPEGYSIEADDNYSKDDFNKFKDCFTKTGKIKIKGFRVDMEFLEDYDHYDNVYFESTEDFIFPCEYWSDGEEKAYEEPDQAIEREFEDYFDEQDNLYDESVNEVKPNSSHSGYPA